MKKWLAGLMILIALGIAAVYILIPKELTISAVESIQCNVHPANRYLGDERLWDRWWPKPGRNEAGLDQPSAPGELPSPHNGSFVYEGTEYRMPGRYQHLIEVQIVTPDSAMQSEIAVVGVADNPDSTLLQWSCHIRCGWDPFGRIKAYRNATHIKENMSGILEAFRIFAEDKMKVYGIRIEEVSTTDSCLVAVRALYATRPNSEDMAGLIRKLRTAIGAEGVHETGNPMVNITPAPGGQFELMAAIPTNRELSPHPDIFSRKLIRGKYLMTEVQGGEAAVSHALDRLREYATDYQRTNMAVPFQSLVTDRSVEKDSSKWVTKIYFPVY